MCKVLKSVFKWQKSVQYSTSASVSFEALVSEGKSVLIHIKPLRYHSAVSIASPLGLIQVHLHPCFFDPGYKCESASEKS